MDCFMFDLELSKDLLKVGVFVVVQALVFIVLAKSSTVFSSSGMRTSFRTIRSQSLQRILDALSDSPNVAGDEGETEA
ncbi:hypothetical protein KSP40_PGU015828 [Platanthera guangdongensis]|uniref:Uncharacterized protein n=1 Tax=Platanthera guangdongensis TaxID=2320717 RepID=A0ABR2MQB5_9ASPA